MKLWVTSLASCCIASLLACGSKQGFDAGVASNDSPPGSETKGGTISTKGDSNGSGGVPPAACNPGNLGVTQAKLLSPSLSTTPKVQSLRYELSALSCKDGTAIPLRDQTLFFDLNAVVSGGFPQLNYIVSDPAKKAVVSTGTLQIVEGSDLFGNTGMYAHWKTVSLSYTSNLDKLELEIKLDNVPLSPVVAGSPSFDSYLRIGQAQAVTQAIPLSQ